MLIVLYLFLSVNKNCQNCRLHNIIQEQDICILSKINICTILHVDVSEYTLLIFIEYQTCIYDLIC